MIAMCAKRLSGNSWMVGAGWMALATPAWAQAPVAVDPGAGLALEEVVVTARKREESLLEVPISISALGAAALERSGAKDLEGLSRSVPSLLVEQGSEQDSKRFLVRGISATSSTAATVAVYVDDTPVTVGPESPDLKLFDVSRLEVLRGPQGTLFGASAMGGAIRYISPAPDFAGFSGMVRMEGSVVEEGAENYEIQGAFGGPISTDKVALRGSGFYRRDAGVIDIVDESTGAVQEADADSAESYGGRAALAARLTDHADATLSVLYQNQERNGMPLYFTGRGVTVTTPLEKFQRTERVATGSRDSFVLPNLTLQMELGDVNLVSSTSYTKRDFEIDTDFSYFVQRALGLPDPFGTALVVPGHSERHMDAVVQEIRLAYDHGERFKWQAGAYYLRSDTERSQYVSSQNLTTLVPPLAPLVLPGGGLFVSSTDVVSEQAALFGELTYALTDAVELTAGLRVTRLELDLSRAADGLFNGGPSGVDATSHETPVTPKLSAKWTINPNAMVYATAAKGFREGGPNTPVPSGIPACQAALAALGLTDAPASYESDNLWSYEVGSKFQTDDRVLQAQLAAYHIDWSGIQQSIGLSGGCGFGFVDNVGKAKSDGLEGEVTWRPLDRVSFDVRFAWNDAKLDEDLITGATAAGPIVAAEAGTRLPYVPQWTAGMGVQYDFTLGSNIEGFLRAQFDHVGDMTRDLGTPGDDPRSHERDAYELLSLRAAFTYGRYEFAAFVDNVLNEDTVLYETYQEFAPGTASERTALRPRTIGASVTLRY